MFSRLELLIKDKVADIKNKSVLVIGLGGVGGYAVENLVRSGISNITIVDNDVIEISNLNRQIIALTSNIGEYKTEEFKKRIHAINPLCNVKIINEFIDENNYDILFKEKIDYLVDACDTIKTKEMIIKYCIDNNIKFITCCGTGNKLHPELFEITTLDKTNYDPIAKNLRKFVKDNHINKKIYVVSSKEQGIMKNISTIPSISYVPASAGILLASFVINDIIKGDNNV